MATSHRNRRTRLVILLAAGIALGWTARTIPRGHAPVGGETTGPWSDHRVPGPEEPRTGTSGVVLETIMEQLAATVRHGNKEDRRQAARGVFAELEAADLTLLRAHVEQFSEDMEDGWFVADEFYRRWGELAPREALEFLKSHESYWAGMEESVWSAWARTDPNAAMAAYDPAMEGQYSRQLQEAVLEGLSAADPAKALRFADAQEMGHDGIFTPGNRDGIREGFSATRGLLEYVPVERPRDPFGLALYSWIHRDSEAAFKAMLPLQHDTLRRASLNALFSNWMVRDPDAALAALNGLRDRDLGESTAHRAMQAYLLRHPREALQRLVAQSHFYEDGDPFNQEIDPFADSDPFEEAVPVERGDRPLTYQMSLISEAAASLGFVEGKAAWDSAAAIVDERKRTAALRGAFAGWLRLDPVGAAGFAAAGIEAGSFDGDFPDYAAPLVGKVLAQHDFQQATDWVEALPAGPLREEAIHTAAETQLDEGWHRALAEASPDGGVNPMVFQQAQVREYAPVAEWLASLPPSKGRDDAAGWLVFRLREHDDPSSALQWAATIEDPRTRRHSFEALAREILSKGKTDHKTVDFDFETWSAARPELALELRQGLARKRDGEGDDE